MNMRSGYPMSLDRWPGCVPLRDGWMVGFVYGMLQLSLDAHDPSYLFGLSCLSIGDLYKLKFFLSPLTE